MRAPEMTKGLDGATRQALQRTPENERADCAPGAPGLQLGTGAPILPGAAHSGPVAGLHDIAGTQGSQAAPEALGRAGTICSGKLLETLRAELALAGIAMEPSRNEAGARTLILTCGAWTREVVPDDLAGAIEAAREFQAAREGRG